MYDENPMRGLKKLESPSYLKCIRNSSTRGQELLGKKTKKLEEEDISNILKYIAFKKPLNLEENDWRRKKHIKGSGKNMLLFKASLTALLYHL